MQQAPAHQQLQADLAAGSAQAGLEAAQPPTSSLAWAGTAAAAQLSRPPATMTQHTLTQPQAPSVPLTQHLTSQPASAWGPPLQHGSGGALMTHPSAVGQHALTHPGATPSTMLTHPGYMAPSMTQRPSQAAPAILQAGHTPPRPTTRPSAIAPPVPSQLPASASQGAASVSAGWPSAIRTEQPPTTAGGAPAPQVASKNGGELAR